MEATGAQLGAEGFSPNLVLLSLEGGAATVPGFPIHYSRCLLAQGKERRGEEERRGDESRKEAGRSSTNSGAILSQNVM